MAASHFFVGIGVGAAMLVLPLATMSGAFGDTFAPPTRVSVKPELEVAAAQTRPYSGYKPGQPTQTPLPLPTLQPITLPTPQPTSAAMAARGLTQPGWQQATVSNNGQGTFARQAIALEGPRDVLLAEGTPVLLSPYGSIRLREQEWRSVRGLDGALLGWVPVAHLRGVEPQSAGAPTVAGARATPPAQPSAVAASERRRVANTDGVGVILRNSPTMDDRSRNALVEGAVVTVQQRQGAEWAFVRAENGLSGWVPTQYLGQ